MQEREEPSQEPQGWCLPERSSCLVGGARAWGGGRGRFQKATNATRGNVAALRLGWIVEVIPLTLSWG